MVEDKVVVIYRKGWLKQKYYAKFIASNNRTLAHTEFYVSKKNLENMLQSYYPDWTIGYAT